ncbi:MAG: hypothetical protein GY814_13065 [Gammaproteobacteria bacterium]|nr:hypothetical protein [Gammaproteobacteria bacterium]
MIKCSLNLKIVTPVILIAAIATGLSAFLNYGKFQRTFTDLESSRFTFALNNIRNAMESGLDLGLALENLTNKDPQIMLIVIFDDEGKIVHLTGNSKIKKVPQAWAHEMTLTPGKVWRANEPETLVLGMPLVNNFGQIIGGVALRCDWSEQIALLKEMATNLIFGAALITAFTAFITLIMVSFLVQRTQKALVKLGRDLDAAQTGSVKAAPEEIVRMAVSTREVRVELSAARRQLMQLLESSKP